MHHGQASSALSVLHKAGRIVRLAEKRNRCHVYVMPNEAVGRVVQPHGRKQQQVETTDAEIAALADVRAIIGPEAQWKMHVVADAHLRALVGLVERLVGRG
jgi:hypothetical protein